MSTIKSALGLSIVAILSTPIVANGQHATHEGQAASRSMTPISDSLRQNDSTVGTAQHRDHPVMDQEDHPNMDHSSTHRSHHSSQDPNFGLREPIPAITDADRAAAFPELEVELLHGSSRHSFWLLDQLEAVDASEGTEISWDAIGWVGSDLNRLWLRSEGSALDGSVENGQIEALYGRAVLPWWDVVAGVRQDFGDGPSRTWTAFGVQGLAPYFFEIEVTAYVGESGRTALSLEADYDMLLTNRLILTWETEANAFGKSDPERVIGSGLSTVEFGLRLRYEINRQFAPYIGFEREWSFGETADLRTMADQTRNDSKWLVGVRLWF